jgi:hypothetical protein
MLREVIERCPDDQWTEGKYPREFWRLAYHTLFYTHLYLEVREADFKHWAKDPRVGGNYPNPDDPPLSKADLLEYCDIVDARVEPQLALIDLDSPDAGFPWYDIPKLDHQVLSIRHIQEHGGQLRDRLLERDDYPEEHLDWISIVT